MKIKNRITSLLLVLALVLSGMTLMSCSGDGDGEDETSGVANPTCEELMTAIVAQYSDIPDAGTLYLGNATEESNPDNYLDPDYAGLIYTGEFEAVDVWTTVTDFAIRLPAGKSAFEIHVFKTTNTEAISAMLSMRMSIIENSDIKLYDAESYEKVFSNAEILVIGDYVFLLITTDNSLAKNAINDVMYS